jgi:glycosyltransferase involved in cell wall biosynthesis
MLSIITPVHNQIEQNKLFIKSLEQYTKNQYELIIIDNNSTDGSADFFESKGCQVIRNSRNYCYSDSMNMGIDKAKYDILGFLNNDLYLGVDWDQNLIEAMDAHNLDVVSPIGIQQMPTLLETQQKTNKWKSLGGKKYKNLDMEGLEELINQMYGNWEEFCAGIKKKYEGKLMDGIVGNTVVVRRDLLEKVNNWDPMILEADYDFYLKVRKREEEVGDVKRPMAVCSSYVHHFINATVRSTKKPFRCSHELLNYKEKWSKPDLEKFWPFPHQIEDKPTLTTSPHQYLRYKLKKIFGRFEWGDSYYK